MNTKDLLKLSAVTLVIMTLATFLGVTGYHAFAPAKLAPALQSVGGDLQVNYFSGGTNKSVTAATSSTAVLASNTGRQYAIIVNSGTSAVFLSLGATAVANQGVYLAASGGSYEINEENLFVGAINAIAVGSSSNLAVYEK